MLLTKNFPTVSNFEEKVGFNIILYGVNYYALYNPVSNNYWLLSDNKKPLVEKQILVSSIISHNKKFINLSIPKNGCSSILKAALIADGHIPKNAPVYDNRIWTISGNIKHRCNIIEENTTFIKNSDYKKFIVVEDEYKRFFRWMNWTDNNRYLTYLKFDLPLEKRVDELLFAYKLFNTDLEYNDPHCVPQSVFHQQFGRYYNMNDIEKISLSDLENFMLDEFGIKMEKINVSSSKIFTEESLSTEQKNKIISLIS